VLGVKSTKQDLNYALAVTIGLKDDCLAYCVDDQMARRVKTG